MQLRLTSIALGCALFASLAAVAQAPAGAPANATGQCKDGSYWTGWQFANENHFPAERSSWTAAAVILAADALTGFSPGSSIFRDASAPRLPGDVRPTVHLDGADACPPADPEACGCALASADAVARSL